MTRQWEYTDIVLII